MHDLQPLFDVRLDLGSYLQDLPQDVVPVAESLSGSQTQIPALPTDAPPSRTGARCSSLLSCLSANTPSLDRHRKSDKTSITMMRVKY